MAKEIWKIKNFGRGIIQTSGEGNSPQDSATSLNGFDATNQTKIVNGNSLLIEDALGNAGNELNISSNGNQSNVGRGLITFGVDWGGFDEAPADGANPAKEHMIVGTDEDDADYWILNITSENTIPAAGTHKLEHGVAASNVIPHMFFDSGVLRISDSNYANQTTNNLWRGFINRKFFTGTAKEYTYRGWYQSDAEIKSPVEFTSTTNGYSRVASGASSYSAANISSTAGDISLHCKVESSSITNSLWEGTWDFAVSYVYDDAQESLLHYLYADGSGNGLTIGGDKKVTLTCITENDDDQKGNMRWSAIKVYCKKQGSVGFGTNNWYLLGNFDIGQGALETHRDTGGTAWTSSAAEDIHYANTGIMIEPVLNDTYADETGHLAEHPITGIPYASVYARYRTAAICNRRLYVGNVRLKDNSSAGYSIEEDAIYRSPVNQFDKIPQTFKIESQVNDGDSIVHLESYADRILEFKENRLNIHNCTQIDEFLEGTYEHRGVHSPSAVTKTEFGVVWTNIYGCFLYNAEQIIDLTLTKESNRFMSNSVWKVYNGQPMIGYLPTQQKIVILDHSGDGLKSALFCHIPTLSWSSALGNDTTWLQDDDLKTNFINAPIDITEGSDAIKKGALMYHARDASDNLGKFWYINGGSSTSKAASWVSQPITFDSSDDDPTTGKTSIGKAQRKKLYKMYVTSVKAGSSKISVWIKVKGSKAHDSGTAAGDWTSWISLGYLAEEGTANYETTKEFSLKGLSNTDTSNVYAIQIKVAASDTGGTATVSPNGFELHDISVSYRRKAIR